MQSPKYNIHLMMFCTHSSLVPVFESIYVSSLSNFIFISLYFFNSVLAKILQNSAGIIRLTRVTLTQSPSSVNAFCNPIMCPENVFPKAVALNPFHQ